MPVGLWWRSKQARLWLADRFSVSQSQRLTPKPSNRSTSWFVWEDGYGIFAMERPHVLVSSDWWQHTEGTRGVFWASASMAIRNVKIPLRTSGQMLHPQNSFERNNDNTFWNNNIVPLYCVDSAHILIAIEPVYTTISSYLTLRLSLPSFKFSLFCKIAPLG